MWSRGLFGGAADAACFVAALLLCLGVVWRVGRKLGPPKFAGAVVALWALAALALPPLSYLAAGMGLWTGLLIFERAGAAYVAAVGLVLAPSLVCFLALSLLARLFTAPREPETSSRY